MASRILMVVLVLIVLGAVGFAVWLSLQPASALAPTPGPPVGTLQVVRQPVATAPLRSVDPTGITDFQRTVREQVTGLLE